MGGLISLYGFLRRPDVFGFAGVMSPSLWIARGAIFNDVQQLPSWDGRLYLDTGTGEGRAQVRHTREMARHASAQGPTPATAAALCGRSRRGAQRGGLGGTVRAGDSVAAAAEAGGVELVGHAQSRSANSRGDC